MSQATNKSRKSNSGNGVAANTADVPKPKRPTPPGFGRKLTDAEKKVRSEARAAKTERENNLPYNEKIKVARFCPVSKSSLSRCAFVVGIGRMDDSAKDMLCEKLSKHCKFITTIAMAEALKDGKRQMSGYHAVAALKAIRIAASE